MLNSNSRGDSKLPPIPFDLHGNVGVELSQDKYELFGTTVSGHDLPQQLSVDCIIGLDKVCENDIAIGSVLGERVEGLLDVIGTVDAALAEDQTR